MNQWLATRLLAVLLILGAAAPMASGAWPLAPPDVRVARYEEHFLTSPPGSSFHPQTVPGPYPPHGGNAAVPTFTWGYFGARSSPTCSAHKGYYGDRSNFFVPRQ